MSNLAGVVYRVGRELFSLQNPPDGIVGIAKVILRNKNNQDILDLAGLVLSNGSTSYKCLKDNKGSIVIATVGDMDIAARNSRNYFRGKILGGAIFEGLKDDLGSLFEEMAIRSDNDTYATALVNGALQFSYIGHEHNGVNNKSWLVYGHIAEKAIKAVTKRSTGKK